MNNFQLYDKNKKGTIILSHYRSGGTQLLNTLTSVLYGNDIKISNFKEINFDVLSGKPFVKQTEEMMKHTNYATILLNNSLVISHFYNQGYFDELNKNYNLVILERKDKLTSLLSLPLWEELIHKGLFHKDWKTPLEQTQDMIEFHTHLLNHPIPSQNIHLGWENDIFKKSGVEGAPNQYYYLNYLLKAYQDEINMLKILKNEYNLHTIYYEDYEENSKTLSIYFKNDEINQESLENILVQNKRKIPYIHRNFIDYFDKYTQQVLKDWKFDD